MQPAIKAKLPMWITCFEDSPSGDTFQIQLFPLTSWCCYQDLTTKCHLSCTYETFLKYTLPYSVSTEEFLWLFSIYFLSSFTDKWSLTQLGNVQNLEAINSFEGRTPQEGHCSNTDQCLPLPGPIQVRLLSLEETNWNKDLTNHTLMSSSIQHNSRLNVIQCAKWVCMPHP